MFWVIGKHIDEVGDGINVSLGLHCGKLAGLTCSIAKDDFTFTAIAIYPVEFTVIGRKL